MRIMLAVCAGVVLAGCVPPVTEADVSRFTTTALCLRYGMAMRDNPADPQIPILRSELARRGQRLDAEADDLIRSEKVRVGISTCVLTASWGVTSAENRTTTASGTRIQHVFGFSGRRNYVYSENGRVTAIQD
jgi:hypothetical protein